MHFVWIEGVVDPRNTRFIEMQCIHTMVEVHRALSAMYGAIHVVSVYDLHIASYSSVGTHTSQTPRGKEIQ